MKPNSAAQMPEILNANEQWSKLGGMEKRDMAYHIILQWYHGISLGDQSRLEALGAAAPLAINKATGNTTSELQANLISLHAPIQHLSGGFCRH